MKNLILFGCLVLLLVMAPKAFSRSHKMQLGYVRHALSIECIDEKCESRSLRTRTCKCDDKCNQYGDCCIDAPKRTSNVSSVPACDQVSSASYFVNRTCHKINLINKCQSSTNYTMTVRKLRLLNKVPVTDLISNITYGNVFCARCNKVSNMSIQYWNVSISCRTVSGNITFYNSSKNKYSIQLSDNAWNLTFNSTSKTWTVVTENDTESCVLRPKLPDVLKNYVRPCFANVTKSCPASSNLSSECLAYQSLVADRSGVMYRNRHCAECNGVDKKSQICAIKSLSPIIIFEATTESVSRVPTSTKRISTTTFHSVGLPPPTSKNVLRKFLVINITSDCATFLSSANFTRVTAAIVRYPDFNRTYVKNQVGYVGNSIQICQYSSRKNAAGPLYSFDKFIANAGSVLSILLQVPNLWVFFVQTSARSLYQKNMVSFTIALILSNAGMLLDNFRDVDTFTAFCGFADLLMYFGFLSSFFWISSLAFEMSCTVWTVGGGFADLARVQDEKKFWTYSMLSWVSPAFIISTMVAFAGPRFDDGTCAYTSDQVFLLFFVFPLTVTMSINLAFYICSAYVVYTEPKTAEKLTILNLKFAWHAAFILVINFTWAVMLLAMYYHSYILLMVFTFLNLLSGFFVYLCSPTENFISNAVFKVTDNILEEEAE